MKKLNALFSLLIVILFIACGPAAENREAMYVRSKVFQDSIAQVIKNSMDAVAAPAPGAAPVSNSAIPLDTTKRTAVATSTKPGC